MSAAADREVEQRKPVRRYRVFASLVFGTELTGLLFLVLKAAIPTGIALLLSLFLLPGGILLAPFFPSEGIGSPLAVLAANAVVYSLVAYAAIVLRKAEAATLRRATMRFAAPAIILAGLACTPALNPLWPHGMKELAKQESELQAALPSGVGLDQSRVILRSKGIQFWEETESLGGVILERGHEKLVAAVGDRLLSARFPTEASVFPCGYDMEIVLLFDKDGKPKQQYVHRFRICP